MSAWQTGSETAFQGESRTGRTSQAVRSGSAWGGSDNSPDLPDRELCQVGQGGGGARPRPWGPVTSLTPGGPDKSLWEEELGHPPSHLSHQKTMGQRLLSSPAAQLRPVRARGPGG